jgi:hypothetical protein
MCVTCLFEVHELSLLSTKYVALRTSYNIELTQHKHTIQLNHNKTRQAIEKGWFNILYLLRYCGKRDMAKGLWIAGDRFESYGLSKIKLKNSLCFTKHD